MADRENEYLRRYYNMLFPRELKEKEYVCLFIVLTDDAGEPQLGENGQEIKFHKYAKNFEQYQEYVEKYRQMGHVYNALATVKCDDNGELHRREANMYRRSVLFIDFDKKDYPDMGDAYDFTLLIKDKFPDMFLHAYYDSGHGYHYYVIVPTEYKIRELSDLNKEICAVIGADTNACKVTQVARVPCTYNRKHLDENGEFPMVKEIDHYKKHPDQVKRFHPCNIDYIKRRLANAKKMQDFQAQPLSKWDYTEEEDGSDRHPFLCTERVLREGADKGERNVWLGRIISMLRFEGYTEPKVREICLDWNTRCRPPKNPEELRDEIWRYLDKEDVYKLNGCWDKIQDDRIREIVRSKCDKKYCREALEKTNLMIEPDIGVKMSQKLLTDGRLRNEGDVSMSGYEYLIMTILYKYLKPKSRAAFTVKALKDKMQWKKNGKWRLCMDIETFKSTLEKLCEHKCIEMIVPETAPKGKKKITYDDTMIKIKRGLKELDGKFIEFYYSAARAFISNQITQNEFKVYLCLVNNMKEGKSCTLRDLNRILGIGEGHIAEAIKALEKAQCIDVIQYRGKTGKWYSRYYQKHTDEYNNETYDGDVKIKIDTPKHIDNEKVMDIPVQDEETDVTCIALLA